MNKQKTWKNRSYHHAEASQYGDQEQLEHHKKRQRITKSPWRHNIEKGAFSDSRWKGDTIPGPLEPHCVLNTLLVLESHPNLHKTCNVVTEIISCLYLLLVCSYNKPSLTKVLWIYVYFLTTKKLMDSEV